MAHTARDQDVKEGLAGVIKNPWTFISHLFSLSLAVQIVMLGRLMSHNVGMCLGCRLLITKQEASQVSVTEQCTDPPFDIDQHRLF